MGKKKPGRSLAKAGNPSCPLISITGPGHLASATGGSFSIIGSHSVPYIRYRPWGEGGWRDGGGPGPPSVMWLLPRMARPAKPLLKGRKRGTKKSWPLKVCSRVRRRKTKSFLPPSFFSSSSFRFSFSSFC